MVEKTYNRTWPDRERPREQLIHCSAEALTDSELLAIHPLKLLYAI